MLKFIKTMLCALMVLTLTACGGSAEKIVTETDHITIDGICVDDSYKNKDNASLKKVYLFYTLHANDTNLEYDSKYTDLIINETNKYTSEHYPRSGTYMPNIKYTSYIQDLYVGESAKVLATFEIPAADLEAGKTITFDDNQLPDEEKLKLSTDTIVHYNNEKEIAKAMDPQGYASEMDLRKDADSATVNKVKNAMNGYYWSFYVNSTSYKLEFSEPNNFYIETSFLSNTGTYSVKKGFIVLKYGNGTEVEIKYDYVDGEVKLYAADAFDVREG